MFGPTASGYAQPQYPEPNKLSLNELLALFGRNPIDARWVPTADSEEYLTLLAWLVERSAA